MMEILVLAIIILVVQLVQVVVGLRSGNRAVQRLNGEIYSMIDEGLKRLEDRLEKRLQRRVPKVEDVLDAYDRGNGGPLPGRPVRRR